MLLALAHGCKFLRFCNRFTKFCNMWSPIRRKTSLIPCPSYSAGKFMVTFQFYRFLAAFGLWSISFKSHVFHHIFAVTGMAARVGMFTSSLDPKALCHHMILPINTLMQMNIRSIPLNSHNILNLLCWCLCLILMFHMFSTQWVSHRNHRGNICGVDFIWLLNPNRYRKLLKTSWSEAVFGMFKVCNSFFSTLHPFLVTGQGLILWELISWL